MEKDRNSALPPLDKDSVWLGSFIADEPAFDRGRLWRLGAWGCAAVSAVAIGLLASHWSAGMRYERTSTEAMLHQSQLLQKAASDSLGEVRRLASAVDTLNGDRDRVFGRLASLEQNLDSVTGSISAAVRSAADMSTAPAPRLSAPPVSQTVIVPSLPDTKPVDPAPPGDASKTNSLAANTPSDVPDASPMPAAPPSAAKPETSSMVVPPSSPSSAPPAAEIAASRTQFGLDIGGADSFQGLRGLWSRLLNSNKDVLQPLRPIVVIKEPLSKPGAISKMQLRLVAGPIDNAAAAADLCAKLAAGGLTCETSAFEGQRLSMIDDAVAPQKASAPRSRKPRTGKPEAAVAKPPSSTLSSFVGNR